MIKAVLIIVFTFVYSSAYAEEFVFVTAQEPPTNYMENGEITGTTTDIVRALIKQTKIKSEIRFVVWARAMYIAKKQPNVGIFTAGRTQARIDHGFHFIGPVFTRKHTLFGRKGEKFEIHSIADIRRQKLLLGSMNGDWRGYYFKERGVNVQFVSNHSINMKKLISGRLDLVISSDLEAPSVARSAGIDPSQLQAVYVFKVAPSYIMLSRDTPKKIVDKWKEGFFVIQSSDFFAKTASKWRERLGIKLNYQPDSGFYVEQRRLVCSKQGGPCDIAR